MNTLFYLCGHGPAPERNNPGASGEPVIFLHVLAHWVPEKWKSHRKNEPLVASLLLVVMPGAPSSFLLLVVRPGAPSSVLHNQSLMCHNVS